MLLKHGSSGPPVTRLQHLLSEQGFFAAADGAFGPATELAVKSYQKAHGLTADGIVGLMTWSVLVSKGAFVMTPTRRFFGIVRGVDLWHVKIDRSKVNVSYQFAGDPQLFVGKSKTFPRKPLTKLASDAGALLAINGGFFDTLSGWPIGPTIHEGKAVNDLADYNGNRLAIVSLDPLQIHTNPPNGSCLHTLLDSGVKEAFMTITHLVRNGQVDMGSSEAWLRSAQPRSVFGWNEKEIHLLVADGRSSRSKGITYQEAAQFMLSAGCTDAVDLDSGGSAEMVLLGEIINHPSDGGERPLPAALCFRLMQ